MLKPKLLIDEYIENKTEGINLLTLIKDLEEDFLKLFNLFWYYKLQYDTNKVRFTEISEVRKIRKNIVDKLKNIWNNMIEIDEKGEFIDISKLNRFFLWKKLLIKSDVWTWVIFEKVNGYIENDLFEESDKRLLQDLIKSELKLRNLKDFVEYKEKILYLDLLTKYEKYKFLKHQETWRYQKLIGFSNTDEFYKLFKILKEKWIISDFKLENKFEETYPATKNLRFKVLLEDTEILFYENFYVNVHSYQIDWLKKFYTLEVSELSYEVLDFIDQTYYFLKNLIQNKTIEELKKIFVEEQNYKNFKKNINFNFDTKDFPYSTFYLNKNIIFITDQKWFFKKIIAKTLLPKEIVNDITESKKYQRMWKEIQYYLTWDFLRYIDEEKLFKIVIKNDLYFLKNGTKINFDKYFDANKWYYLRKVILTNKKYWDFYKYFIQSYLWDKKIDNFKQIEDFYDKYFIWKYGLIESFGNEINYKKAKNFVVKYLLDYTNFSLKKIELNDYWDLKHFKRFCDKLNLNYFEYIAQLEEQFVKIIINQIDTNERIDYKLFSSKLVKRVIKSYLETKDISFISIKNFLNILKQKEKLFLQVQTYIIFKLKSFVLQWNKQEVEKTLGLIQFLWFAVIETFEKLWLLDEKNFDILPEFVVGYIKNKEKIERRKLLFKFVNDIKELIFKKEVELILYEQKTEENRKFILDKFKKRKIKDIENKIERLSPEKLGKIRKILEQIEIKKITDFFDKLRLPYNKQKEQEPILRKMVYDKLNKIANLLLENNLSEAKLTEEINLQIDDLKKDLEKYIVI